MNNITSEQLMKGSLLLLHILLLVLTISILRGREAAVIGDMYSSTLWAIMMNLGVLGGNKALQKFADKAVTKEGAKTDAA